jgi:hypothetical protein
VDYDDNNDENEEDDDEEYHHEDKDDENEYELEEQEQIDPDEVDDTITSDAREGANPTIHEEEDQPKQLEVLNDQEDTNVVSEGDEEESQATESTRRLTQQTSPIARLEPTLYGKSSCKRRIE